MDHIPERRRSAKLKTLLHAGSLALMVARRDGHLHEMSGLLVAKVIATAMIMRTGLVP